jgi:hypothetical protein
MKPICDWPPWDLLFVELILWLDSGAVADAAASIRARVQS